MKKMMLGAILSLYVSASGAAIIYASPETVIVRGTVEDNIVVQHWDVNIEVGDGGTVVGNGGAESGSLAALRMTYGNLDITGSGRVVAAQGREAIHQGGGGSVVRLKDQATVYGRITSGHAPGWDDEKTARSRLYLQDQALVIGDVFYAGFMRMEDQAVIRGNLMNAHNGYLRVDMTGGLVTGSMRMSAGDRVMLNMEGGTILGDIQGIWGDLDLNMTGGVIAGGIRTGAGINGDIRGGRIQDGMFIATAGNNTHLRITGGQFDTALDDWLIALTSERSTSDGWGLLEIAGGEFGYAGAGLGFLVDGFMSLNVYGRDLVFADGWLTGYLQDGNWFNQALTFGDNWQGAFNIHNVPEPGTLALLLMGALGCAAAGRRRVAGREGAQLS